MDDSTLQALREVLAKNNNFAIVTGENPSIDAMAAALSFYYMLKNVGKKVTVVCPSDPIVELSSLVGIHKVQKTLGGEPNDLVVSFPYIKGEIEKVSYTLEDGYLNIIVKAAQDEFSFDEKEVKYMRGSGKLDVIIVVGTPKLTALGALYNAEKFKDTALINIDNQEDNQGFGDITLVSPRLSSVSEQIAHIALGLGFRVEKDIAQNLLTGISDATNNFQNISTSPLAFEMAALLLKKGASRKSNESARNAGISFTPKNQDGRYGQDQRSNPKQHRFPHQKTYQAERTEENSSPPVDWLTPKVYKGSSSF